MDEESLERRLSDLEKHIEDLRSTNYGRVAVVITCAGLLIGLQHNIEAADFSRADSEAKHNAGHIEAVEQVVKELREYTDARMFTKEDHTIFDKDRFEELKRVEDRLQFIERQCVQKKP